MFLIKNARILTMEGPEIGCGDILVEDGRIREIGVGIDVDCLRIEAGGLLAVPGLIDAHTHIGMIREGASFDFIDVNDSSDPIQPQLRAVDGFDPLSESLESAVEAGVTTIMTGPGSGNVIGGQFAVFKTAGDSFEEMLVRAPAAMKVAFGENPSRFYGKDQKRTPFNRMAIASLLREFLIRARHYCQRKEMGEEPEYDPKLEAMRPVFRKEIPLKIHAHRVEDMHLAVRIAREFELEFTLDHCTEAHLDAENLAREIPEAIVGPYLYVADKMEVSHVSPRTPGALFEEGVQVAICSDWPVVPMEYFMIQAGLAIREGMPEEEVWKAVTVNPARILGLEDRIGTLSEGKDADIVLFEGNPLRDICARVRMTVINGKIVYRA